MSRPSWRTVAGYAAARIVPALASLATTLLCVQALSAEHYAVFSLTALPATVAAGFAGAAAGQSLQRYALELRRDRVGTALLGLPLAVSAAALVVLALYYFAVQRWGLAALLAAAAVPALVLIDTRRAWFIAHGAVGRVFAIDSGRAVATLLLTLLLLWQWGAHPAAPLAAGALAAFAALGLVRSTPRVTRTTGKQDIDRSYLGHGLSLAVWLAVILGLSLAERSVVADRLGLAASGSYAAQADVINALFAAAGSALAAAMMPAYLRSASANAADSARVFRSLLGYAATAVLALATATAVLGWALGATSPALGQPQALVSLTADAATGGLLIAAAAAWTMAGFVQKPAEMRGRAWHIVWAVLAALLSFLLLAPWAASEFGAPGVAGAKLAASGVFMAWVAAAGWAR